MERANSSTSSTVSTNSRRSTRLFTILLTWRSSAMSASIWRRALGRCTFTATERPVCSSARCTWPIEAAATGTGSKAANRSPISPFSSCRITCCTSS